VNASALAATNAVENNWNYTKLKQLAATLSPQEFTELAFKEYEKEYGPIPSKKKGFFVYQFAHFQNALNMTDFNREMLNPGQRLFEETASLSYEDFRALRLSEMNPKKLLTSKGWEKAERIIQNHYGFYQQKQFDLTIAPLFGILGGALGSTRVLGRASVRLVEGAPTSSASTSLVLQTPSNTPQLKLVLPRNVVDSSNFSSSSKIVALERRGRVTFDNVEFRAVRDLGHMSELDLKDMMRTGRSPYDKVSRALDLHHHKQQYHRNPGAFLAEIPKKDHNISNALQHPYGNKKGSGLTLEERRDWEKVRKAFNKERAKQELLRRGILSE
jgi:hypothetical protein